jgi:hypothetical protein
MVIVMIASLVMSYCKGCWWIKSDCKSEEEGGRKREGGRGRAYKVIIQHDGGHYVGSKAG